MKQLKILLVAVCLVIVACIQDGNVRKQQASWPEFENQAINLIRGQPTVDINSCAGRPWLGQTWKDLYFANGTPARKPAKGISPLWRPFYLEERIDEMRAGNLSTIVVSVIADFYVDANNPERFASYPRDGRRYKKSFCFRCKNQFDYIYRVFKSDKAELALTPSDIRRNAKAGKQSIIIEVVGGEILHGDLEILDNLYNNDIRILELIHNHANRLGDTQSFRSKHGGLTAFGKQVVKRMNELGMMIDVAHATFTTVKDVVAITTDPIILSHSYIGSTFNLTS